MNSSETMDDQPSEWTQACHRVEKALRKALQVIEADADPLVARAAASYREVIRGVDPEPAGVPAEEFSAVDRHLPGAVDGADLGNTGSVS